MEAATGAYSAGTGPSNPVTLETGASQNVIFGGADGSASTSSLALFDHDSGALLHASGGVFDTGGQGSDTGLGGSTYGTCAFDPPDTDGEVDSVGIETEWALEQVTWRHEVVSFGTGEADAGVRLTQAVTNHGAEPVTLGVRWMIDYQSAADDGPLLAPVICDPFSVGDDLTTEQELVGAEIADFYRMRNNDGSTTVVENYTSTVALADHEGTATPDRVVFGDFFNLSNAGWDFSTSGAGDPDRDSAVLVYFGRDAASAFTIEPGGSVSRSVVIFSAVDADGCGQFTPIDTGSFDSGTEDTSPVVDSALDSAVDSAAAEAVRGGAWSGGRVCGKAALVPFVLVVLAASGRRRRGTGPLAEG